MKFAANIFFAFCLAVIIGTALSECTRYIVAKSLGYSIDSDDKYGALFFENEKMQAAIKPVRDANKEALFVTHKNFPDKNKWDEYIEQDKKDKAMIELARRLFTFTVSFAGWIILFVRRKERHSGFKMIDWIALVMALFIMRLAGLSLIYIVFGSMPCDIAKMARYFNWPAFGFEKITALAEVVISAFVILVTVPRKRIISFTISGALGGLAGTLIYFYVVSRIFYL